MEGAGGRRGGNPAPGCLGIKKGPVAAHRLVIRGFSGGKRAAAAGATFRGAIDGKGRSNKNRHGIFPFATERTVVVFHLDIVGIRVIGIIP